MVTRKNFASVWIVCLTGVNHNLLLVFFLEFSSDFKKLGDEGLRQPSFIQLETVKKCFQQSFCLLQIQGCGESLFFQNCHRFLVAGGQTVDPAEAAADLIDSGQAENLPNIGG